MFLLGAKKLAGAWIYNIPLSMDVLVSNYWSGTNINDGGNYSEIFYKGIDNGRYTVSEDTALRFSGDAIAVKSDATIFYSFHFEFSVIRNSGGVMTTNLSLIHDDEESFGIFDLTIDETDTESNNAIVIKVKNPDTYVWKIEGKIIELTV